MNVLRSRWCSTAGRFPVMRTSSPALLAAAAVALLSGCTATFGEVFPRPNVAISGSAEDFALDLTAVPDVVELDRVRLEQFGRTLLNGFKSAVGSHFAEPPQEATTLVLQRVEPEFAHVGQFRYLTIRYRAVWRGSKGEVLGEVAGMAEPRNPAETGARHLEDVVEVMYEQLINGLSKVRPGAPAAPPTEEGKSLQPTQT